MKVWPLPLCQMRTIKTTASVRIRCSERARRRINGQRPSTLPLLEDLQTDPRGIIIIVAAIATVTTAAISTFRKLGGSHCIITKITCTISMAHSCLRAWIRIYALSDWCDACLLVQERPLQEQLF